MASSLKTLIKIAKSEVDAKQKELAEVQMQQDAILALMNKMKKELTNEKALTEENYDNQELAASFSSYATATLAKIQQSQDHFNALEGTIEILRDKLRDAFAEQKKFEIVEAANLKKALDEHNRKEGAKLDEVGTNMFARKGSE